MQQLQNTTNGSFTSFRNGLQKPMIQNVTNIKMSLVQKIKYCSSFSQTLPQENQTHRRLRTSSSAEVLQFDYDHGFLGDSELSDTESDSTLCPSQNSTAITNSPINQPKKQKKQRNNTQVIRELQNQIFDIQSKIQQNVIYTQTLQREAQKQSLKKSLLHIILSSRVKTHILMPEVREASSSAECSPIQKISGLHLPPQVIDLHPSYIEDPDIPMETHNSLPDDSPKFTLPKHAKNPFFLFN